MVGRHIGNAQTKFEDADKRLTRFEEKLIAAGDRPARELSEGSPEEPPKPIEGLPPAKETQKTLPL